MQTFLKRLLPFILVGMLLVVLAFGFILFIYLLLIGTAIGCILFIVQWVREKWLGHKTKPPSKKTIRIIDMKHDKKDDI